MPSIDKTLSRLTDNLLDKKCWYVSCGGSAGPTFSLAVGNKIPRVKPLANKNHSEDFRFYEGEIAIYVWCTWRLEGKDGPLSSSDDSDKRISKALSQLIGEEILRFEIERPCWDLTIRFSGNKVLRVFCDHVSDNASFDGNWEVCWRQKCHFFGPGIRYKMLTREL